MTRELEPPTDAASLVKGVHGMCSPCAEQYSRLRPSRDIVVGVSGRNHTGNEGSLMKTSHYVIGSLLAAGLLLIAPACASTYGCSR